MILGFNTVLYYIVNFIVDFDDFQGLATLFSDLVSETPVYQSRL